MQGWIKLHRQILEHKWFKEKRVYSKFEAWIDLLLLANHKDDKVCINSTWILVKRGQHLTSIKKLSERWKWSNRKVKKYLDLLVSDEMCTYKCTSKYTLLTLANYDFYQGREHEKAFQTHIKRTSEAYQTHTNKNDKEDLRMGEEVYTTPTLIKGGKYDGDSESNRTSTHLEFFK